MSKPAKAEKAATLKPRLPRGFVDRGPADIAATHRMLEKIRESFELYGFEAVETPFIEYTEALGKFLPDLDRPNEGVFSFQDDDESWLSLRYDLTAPLARYVAEHFDALPKPYRSYRAGYVFRNEKPGPGRFRQFMQFDADIVGSASIAADAEICMMAADTLERLGIARGDYVVKVNNRKILDGLMEAVGLSSQTHAGTRLAVLRALDKYDRLGRQGVESLLGAGRKDESGAFSPGAGLDAETIRRLIYFVTIRSNSHGLVENSVQDINPIVKLLSENGIYYENDMLSAMLNAYGSSDIFAEGISELRTMANLFKEAGFEKRIIIDPSVVRGLEYYTGPVYEAELTFPVVDEDGQTVRFGSVAGGGRYDGLVGRFRSEPVPATGFSVGVSRLFSALQIIRSPLVAGHAKPGPVVVLVLDREEIPAYQRLVASLRQAGLRAELYLGASGMKAQMKYADRRGAPCVVIQGSDERARGEVQIKDLIEGARAAEAIASNAEWKAARPAQFSVPEDEMVARVREVVGRHFGG